MSTSLTDEKGDEVGDDDLEQYQLLALLKGKIKSHYFSNLFSYFIFIMCI